MPVTLCLRVWLSVLVSTADLFDNLFDVDMLMLCACACLKWRH